MQSSRTHSSLREGTLLGLVVATSIWLWVAAVDAIVGQPFHTFAVLGGVALFTVMHYALNWLYAVLIVWAIHRSSREPSLVMGAGFGFVIVEFGFAMLTVLLGAAVASILLLRTHPLRRQLRAAEAQERE